MKRSREIDRADEKTKIRAQEMLEAWRYKSAMDEFERQMRNSGILLATALLSILAVILAGIYGAGCLVQKIWQFI